MPTYTIDMRGDPASQAWAEGASALAQAFTPDYEGIAKGQIGAAQADAAYARSAASQAAAGSYHANTAKTQQETADLVFQQNQRQALLTAYQNGELSMEDLTRLAVQTGVVMDPTGAMPHLGSGNLAIAATDPNATAESLSNFQIGSGKDYGDTFVGTQDQQAHEIALEQAKPVTLSSNQTAYLPPGDPRLTGAGTSLSGSTVINDNQQLTFPDGGDAITGPNFREKPPEAPTIKTYNEGTEEVTVQYKPEDPLADANGWVVIARGPRTGTTGEVVQNPLNKALTEVAVETVSGVYGGRLDAQARIDNAVKAQQLLAASGSGKLTELALPLRQWATAMGLGDAVQTGTTEALVAALGDFAMSRIQETKGAVSEKEMDYFIKISPELGKTVEGNMLLMKMHENAGRRSLRAANLVDTLRKEGMDAFEISEEIAKFYAENPIIDAQTAAQFGIPPLHDGMSPVTARTGRTGGSSVDIDRY